jgi:hypothetical protein
MSQICAVLSDEPVTTREPSALKTAEDKWPCRRRRTAISFAVAASQIRVTAPGVAYFRCLCQNAKAARAWPISGTAHRRTPALELATARCHPSSRLVMPPVRSGCCVLPHCSFPSGSRTAASGNLPAVRVARSVIGSRARSRIVILMDATASAVRCGRHEQWSRTKRRCGAATETSKSVKFHEQPKLECNIVTPAIMRSRIRGSNAQRR